MIKEVSGHDELKRAIELVNRVFEEFVAVDYGEEGNKTFSTYLEYKLDELTDDLASGNKRMWVYYDNGQLAGVAAVRGVNHVSLLFVDKRFQHRGIARALTEHMINEVVQTHPDVTEFTVNSSPYAVEVYERMGFVPTDAMQTTDGIIYRPMKRKL